jgi:hypothetical protein
MTTTTTPARSKKRSQRKPLTDEERAARREADRERVEASVKALATSEGFRAWIRARAAFRSYSFGNCMLIAFQRPDATRVAPMKRWNELGRTVNKGERAIAINVFAGAYTTKRVDGTEEEHARFKLRACLFDVSQTSGDDLPEYPSEPVTGDSHEPYLQLLEAHARSLGCTVEYRADTGNAGGWFQPSTKEIVVNADAPANRRVATLIHELAHAHGVGYQEFGRELAETIVETAAYIVATGIGLDTGGESFPYIAAWDTTQTEAIREHAARIDSVARAIEDAIHVDNASKEQAA